MNTIRLTFALVFTASLAVVGSASLAAGPSVFHVRDYGAKPDDRSDSGSGVRAAIQAAIESGPGAEIVFEAGTYYVKPRAPRETCFPIHQATNLVVREIRSPTQWLVSPGALILPGDRLQVLDPRTGRVRGEAKVTDVKIQQRAFLIEVGRAVEGLTAGADHRTGDTLYNLDGCGAGFQIRRNHMNGNHGGG